MDDLHPEDTAGTNGSAAAPMTAAPAEDARPSPTDAGTETGAPAPVSATPPPSGLLQRARAHPDRLAHLCLALILVLAAAFRFVGGDWDSGQHLHPDERFLTMVTAALRAPDDPSGYFDTQTSLLNPRNVGYGLFVYGTLPINLVYAIGRALDRSSYGEVYLVGRQLMAIFDLLSICVLYAIGRLLYGRRVAVVAAFLAACTAFLIQQAHFFTVDSAANFFVLLFLLAAVRMMRRGSAVNIGLAGVALGLALASKVSVWPLVPLAVLGLALADRRRGRLSDSRGWVRLAVEIVLLGVAAFLALRVAQPDMWAGTGWPAVLADQGTYMARAGAAPGWWAMLHRLIPNVLEPLLLPDPRWAENMERVRSMITGYGMDWPPNHQWWDRAPYVYPWRNMVLYGLGLPLGLWATVTFLAAGVQLARGHVRHFLPWTWVAVVFAYQGAAWVKTMRYFLPIYPAVILLAAWGLVAALDGARSHRVPRPGRLGARLLRVAAVAVAAAVMIGTLVWGTMVAGIYTREHSRVAGSRWIYHNLPTAVALTVAEGELPGPFLPVRVSNALTVLDYAWTLGDDRRLDPVQVHVPGESEVVVDGVQLGYLTGAAGGERRTVFRAWITSSPFPAQDGALTGVLVEGRAEAELGSDERQVRIGLARTALAPGGEYYLWLGIEGTPVSGRLPIVAVETTWDDHIPVGLDRYAAWDDPATPGAEGFFGQVNLELYDEDDAGKLERKLERLERADFVVITSNRVYGSIAQLPSRFPMTLAYYDLLFGGDLGFAHVAHIHSYPRLGPFQVNDQPADEAWHVYDHPRVDVFAKRPGFHAPTARERLAPRLAERAWQWPGERQGVVGRLADLVVAPLGRWLGEGNGARDEILMDPARWARQQEGGTWSAMFDPDGLVNRSPAVAVIVWYLTLLLLGALAFPIVALALPGLADRGWSVARAVGLLAVSWVAWLVASTGLVPHSPRVVLGAVGLLALASLAATAAGPVRPWTWARTNARLVLSAEAVFLALFVLFLAIRAGNPDLWHPYYGGEKPMDFAYLNAVLRSESFPPYDPWFAGGRMNYYYFGFVMVGALIELTRVVPWVAYNLAIPTLAALTGAGVFGVVTAWSARGRGGRKGRAALWAGGIGALFAVVSGNLFQVPFILGRIADLGATTMRSAIPGVQRLLELAVGLGRMLRGEGTLGVPTGHWYWNASRAIPDVAGDTQPITEFPYFTFLYADLHAHMMALPITVLALAVSLSWVLAPSAAVGVGRARALAMQALRVALGALAIGALWPTNTWDFPTYGLVAAGAIAVGAYARRRSLSVGWAVDVAALGVPLLLFSLLAFWPYHANYVQPYGQFQRWESVRTPASAFLIIHGLFLFPIVTWAVLRLGRDLRRSATRLPAARRLVGVAAVAGTVMATLWWTALARLPLGKAEPSVWTPILGWFLLSLGAWHLTRPANGVPERFMGWVLLLGAALTQLVEHFVLAGDIGRMNTVFKFTIQVWILWAVAAAVALAWLAPALRRLSWGPWWRSAMVALATAGLVYTATAGWAKMRDRFPPMGPMTQEQRHAYEEQMGPGLSGMAYTDYAVYDDNGAYLRLKADADAMRWLMANVRGTPVVLEGFRDAGYRWGARYSIYTGSPTVIGWDWHQKQQRNAGGPHVVDQRIADVREIYDGVDTERALQLMRRHQVRYVVVGQMERAIYGAGGLAKFEWLVAEGLAERVYVGGPQDDPDVVIYRLAQDGAEP